MPDTGNDTLPDESQTQLDVSEDAKPQVEAPTVTEPAPDESGTEQPKGYVPYSDLKRERQRRKEAEARLQNLESSETPNEDYAEPESTKLSSLEREVRDLKLDKLVSQFDLGDKRNELEEYLEDNSDISLDRAVNLFRIERNLIGEAKPPRKGLESPVQGPKAAPKARYSFQEIEDMRINNTRLYQKLLRDGVLD